MTTYTWSFPQFDVAKSEDGLTDVVKTIHWRYDATDGDYSAGAYGTVGLGAPNPQGFVAFENLTEAWTISAVSASIDVQEMKSNLAAQIALAKNPPIQKMTPPF
jgi:hypothetical protein